MQQAWEAGWPLTWKTWKTWKSQGIPKWSWKRQGNEKSLGKSGETEISYVYTM